MAKKTQVVGPLVVPGTDNGRDVVPWGDFALDDVVPERLFFDCVASEHVNTLGTKIGLWKIDLKGSNIDPLYSETIKRVYDGPYVIKGWVEYPPTSPEANEDGFSMDRQQTVWVPRASLEGANVTDPPNPGDIVQFWDMPYYEDASTLRTTAPKGSGYYFEVNDVDEDGYLFDSAEFAGWVLTVRRNTKFVPERKLAQETVAP